jgi:lysozyme family protein
LGLLFAFNILDREPLKEPAMNENLHRWNAMHLHYAALFVHTAKRLCEASAKAQYLSVEAATGVPWYIVAVIHEREASQSWKANLAQGDPWNARSIHVPRGRGPFTSWISAAIDALRNCPPHLASHKDWSTGGALDALEDYNGLGYLHHGVPSPYLWAGTDQYTSGKYVADGHFDPRAVDHQLGCAGLLWAMQAIDNSVMP